MVEYKHKINFVFVLMSFPFFVLGMGIMIWISSVDLNMMQIPAFMIGLVFILFGCTVIKWFAIEEVEYFYDVNNRRTD